ncbi:aldo-keto reductase family 1 member A1-like [Macrosteles quadrilineatus]|uniref:aldo-keto reductase family 1 member A1-like n=1 Tax=Macrosteles quadrilineatus TaxID=74068 RepID=UPI0023E18692|nr:aldo-keto reductase family 1 member A1-like [Macrosteles quadrilineatus]
MANVPTIKFNNGLTCPQFGLGTWKSKPGEVSEAVFHAIQTGYRHIDCALVYQNEREVGQGIEKALQNGICKREDLFITTKLWNTFHKDELVVPSLKQSLENLKLTYVDLYLIHWPQAYKEGDELFPVDADNKTVYSSTPYLETWKAMERCVQQGLAKSIGVSNFNSKQVAKVLENATIKPVTNQVECHPYLNQKKLKAYLDSVGVTLTAYSPLGSPDRPWAKPDEQPLLANEKITKIAEKYNKSPAQIALRWQIEKGNIVIPKSVTKSRIESNIQVFDFSLKPEDIETINSLDCNERMVGLAWIKDHPDYPFNEEF